MTGADSAEVRNEMERARKSLAAARKLKAEGLLEDALSRSYYAILHAARALLLAHGVEVKSHEAVKRMFGITLVQSRKVDPIFARILREGQDDRLLADYDVAFSPEVERVETRIQEAELFMKEADRLLAAT